MLRSQIEAEFDECDLVKVTIDILSMDHEDRAHGTFKAYFMGFQDELDVHFMDSGLDLRIAPDWISKMEKCNHAIPLEITAPTN